MIYHRRSKLRSLACLGICNESRSSCPFLLTLLLDSGNFVNIPHLSKPFAIIQLLLLQVGKGDITILSRQQQALSKHRGVNFNTRHFPNPNVSSADLLPQKPHNRGEGVIVQYLCRDSSRLIKGQISPLLKAATTSYEYYCSKFGSKRSDWSNVTQTK